MKTNEPRTAGTLESVVRFKQLPIESRSMILRQRKVIEVMCMDFTKAALKGDWGWAMECAKAIPQAARYMHDEAESILNGNITPNGKDQAR